MGPTSTTPPAPLDVDAVHAIVQDAEDGFNRNDWELSVAHVACDAVVVTAMGDVWAGRDAIAAANRDGLTGFLKDATAHYRVTDVRCLGSDVIVANKDAWSNAAAAAVGSPPEMRALYVLARRDGRWWIVRRQNTLVPAGDREETYP
jgi:uncharacterized protein (TIGR02246 family)